jgi:hypothetical protein
MSGPHRDLQVCNFAEKLKRFEWSSAPDAADIKTIRIVDLFPSNNNLFRETQWRQSEWQHHTLGERFSQHCVVPTPREPSPQAIFVEMNHLLLSLHDFCDRLE